MLNTHLSSVQTGASQDARARGRGKGTESPGIRQSFHLMDEAKVRETVQINLVLQDDDDPIAPQPYGPHFATEEKLPDAVTLVIVPDNHLVRGIPGGDKREEVASEEHFHDGETVADRGTGPSYGTSDRVDSFCRSAEFAKEGKSATGGGGGGVKFAAEKLTKGVGVEDTETGGGTGGDAGVILVEGEGEKGRFRGGGRRGREGRSDSHG